jgi:hypothetical protein
VVLAEESRGARLLSRGTVMEKKGAVREKEVSLSVASGSREHRMSPNEPGSQKTDLQSVSWDAGERWFFHVGRQAGEQ